jgi:hypothetical protein
MSRKKNTLGWPTIVSLILLTATVVFWHRGYRVYDVMGYRWGDGSGKIELASANGCVALIAQRTLSPLQFSRIEDADYRGDVVPGRLGLRFDSMRLQADRPEDGWSYNFITSVRTSGFWSPRAEVTFAGGATLLRVPTWSLLFPCMLIPVLSALRRHRLGKRRASGLCEHCGYDLRHSPDRCPECGQPKSSDPVENPPKEPAPVAFSP